MKAHYKANGKSLNQGNSRNW